MTLLYHIELYYSIDPPQEIEVRPAVVQGFEANVSARRRRSIIAVIAITTTIYIYIYIYIYTHTYDSCYSYYSYYNRYRYGRSARLPARPGAAPHRLGRSRPVQRTFGVVRSSPSGHGMGLGMGRGMGMGMGIGRGRGKGRGMSSGQRILTRVRVRNAQVDHRVG